MNTPFLESLGATVRAERLARGWSQESLADRCGLHRTYVGGVERGERNISAVNLKRIADALEIPIQRLFDEPGGG